MDFGDSLAKDVMVPKMDVEFANIDFTYQELMECYGKRNSHECLYIKESRDNILGIINLKDIFFYEGSHEDFKISGSNESLISLMNIRKSQNSFFEMKKESIPMAIVLDEYGATAGLLTIEDLIEEIVGEIRDEYDGYEEDEITVR